MLFGEYYHNIDPKGRMIFPAKLRSEIGERFYLTRWLDNCIVAFSESEFMNVCGRIKQQAISKTSDVQRVLFSSACEVEADKQGRILIPASLRARAGLERDVVVIGVMNRAEIWDKERWEEKSRAIDGDMFDRGMLDLDI
ncbi:MAG: division/cell wall cluster transcriptional repressor MraZ [Oscillospiraceae bacterium]